MSKKRTPAKRNKNITTLPAIDTEPETNFFDMFADEPDEDTFVNMMGNMGNILDQQRKAAIDLTRIIIEHQTHATLSKDDILAIYQETLKTVEKDSPMSGMLDELKMA